MRWVESAVYRQGGLAVLLRFHTWPDVRAVAMVSCVSREMISYGWVLERGELSSVGLAA